MKNKISVFLLSFLLATTAAASTLSIDVDVLKSPDHSLIWTPPSSTQTLVGRTSTDTLTNKSISGSANTLTNIPLGTAVTGTLPAASLPNPSASTLGGVESLSAASHQWINTISTSGVPASTQPAFTDISGNLANSQLPSAETWPSSGTVQATTPNAHGILISGSGTTATVLAPDSSTTKVLTSGGSSADPSWQAAGTSPQTPKDSQNFALVPSVASSALTITLKQQDGSTNCTSGAGACVFSFRNATASTGTFAQVSVTGALSITVPSSATLGHPSAQNEYVWIYTLNDAGTVDLCVSGGAVFWDTSLNSSTAISAGATSGAVLYCGTSHTGGKPTRIIGRLLIQEATAGTWLSNATETHLSPQPTINSTSDVDGGVNTVTAVTTSPTFTTAVNNHIFCSREGQYLRGRITMIVTSGNTAGSGTYKFAVTPCSCTIDTSSNGIPAYTSSSNASVSNAQGSFQLGNGSNALPAQVVVYDTSNITLMASASTNAFVGSSTFPMSTAVSYAGWFRVPCSNWWPYGP